MRKKTNNLLALLAFSVITLAQPSYAEMLGVTNGSGELVSIDLGTGAATLIGTLPESMTEAVYDSASGRFYAQGSNGSFQLHEIDPSDGSQISVIPTTGAYNGMEFVGGTLYATVITAPSGPADLATVDPVTGIATTIGATGFNAITGLAFDSSSNTMYGSVGGGDAASGSLVTIDMISGAATLIGPTGFDKVGSIEFGSDGNLYGGLTSSDSTQPNALILINTSSGAGSVVGNTSFSITGLAETVLPAPPAPPQPVPTMSAYGLALTMLGLLFVATHRLRTYAKRK